MVNDSLFIFLLLLTLLLTCLTFGLAIHYRRKADTLSRKLRVALEKLASAHEEMQEREQREQESQAFQKNLTEAELTTRLQQPRLTGRHQYDRVNVPERYHYVRSLAEKGMEASEIAAILSISTREAEQLVNLSRLASGPQQ